MVIKKGNVKLTLSVNKKLLNAYKVHCGREGLVISRQFEKFIKQILKKEK